MPCAKCGKWIERPIWIPAESGIGLFDLAASSKVDEYGNTVFAVCEVCQQLTTLSASVLQKSQALGPDSSLALVDYLQGLVNWIDTQAAIDSTLIAFSEISVDPSSSSSTSVPPRPVSNTVLIPSLVRFSCNWFPNSLGIRTETCQKYVNNVMTGWRRIFL